MFTVSSYWFGRLGQFAFLSPQQMVMLGLTDLIDLPAPYLFLAEKKLPRAQMFPSEQWNVELQ